MNLKSLMKEHIRFMEMKRKVEDEWDIAHEPSFR